MKAAKLTDVAREIAKHGRVLDHQLAALAWLDENLSETQKAEFTRRWRQAAAPAPVYLRLLPTAQFDRRGLRIWYLQLCNGERVVDQVRAFSGAPGRQELVDPRQDYPGSRRPIPPGRYLIGPVEVSPQGSFGPGLGRIWIDLTPVNPVHRRSGFGFHLDANRDTAPGSAGCVVFDTEAELMRLIGWLKQVRRPEFLEVTHQVANSATQQQRDVDILARTIYGEARGEPPVGKAAVAWVVRNRAERSPKYGWPNSIAEVCLQPNQFSCWNAGDPNRHLIEKVDDRDKLFRECLQVAQDVLAGNLPDPTRGADHYYAVYIPRPRWADERKFTVQIGVHRFYRLV